MTQQRESYLNNLVRIRDQVNQLFQQERLSTGFEAVEERPVGIWLPAMDIVEDENAYFLCVELPGVLAEDTDVQATDTRIEISGQRRPFAEGSHFHLMECNYGKFRCWTDLEPDMDVSGMSQSFRRGVLIITVPKTGRSSTPGED